MRRSVAAASLMVLACAGLGLGPASAADLVWEVESPFRLFKPTQSFSLHEVEGVDYVGGH
ncbi:MAG: hypothetical protein EXQ88_08215 [Alphaproteobacteria bacterium]|nr:hypothetical protein [Alphaproteobacteria bacterium]